MGIMRPANEHKDHSTTCCCVEKAASDPQRISMELTHSQFNPCLRFWLWVRRTFSAEPSAVAVHSSDPAAHIQTVMCTEHFYEFMSVLRMWIVGSFATYSQTNRKKTANSSETMLLLMHSNDGSTHAETHIATAEHNVARGHNLWATRCVWRRTLWAHCIADRTNGYQLDSLLLLFVVHFVRIVGTMMVNGRERVSDDIEHRQTIRRHFDSLRLQLHNNT